MTPADIAEVIVLEEIRRQYVAAWEHEKRERLERVAKLRAFYAGQQYLFWQPTWFGKLLRRAGISTRWFPCKWTGVWKERHG